MAHNNRTYGIVNVSDKDTVNFSQVLQNSYDTARKNVAGTQFLVKWNGHDTPSSVSGILQTVEGRTTHTHEEILAILSGTDWTPEDII
jgi:hypothetical protein